MRTALTAMAALALATPATAQDADEEEAACDAPVLMVVSGITLDRDRMMAYGQAIAESRVYEELGGYYLNMPRAIEEFEGGASPNFTTIIVRFPCLANARAFWNSRVYQEDILPLRLDPSAGDYVVRVYPEIPVRSDMQGKVGDNGYIADFTDHTVEPLED